MRYGANWCTCMGAISVLARPFCSPGQLYNVHSLKDVQVTAARGLLKQGQLAAELLVQYCGLPGWRHQLPEGKCSAMLKRHRHAKQLLALNSRVLSRTNATRHTMHKLHSSLEISKYVRTPAAKR